MTDRIVDQDTRNRALDPAASFIIQAPAGSGKTELLIRRYLVLLARVDAPEEIIAITFTRKASAEMQSRILNALQQAAGGNVPVTDYGRETHELAVAALAQNDRCGWEILDNPGRLRIQTIDSLCAVITRQMPILASLGAQPETLEDPVPLYEQAAANTLVLIDSNMEQANSLIVLLEHLDNDHQRIKALLVVMLAKRDQWLPYVVADHRREHMEQALQDLVRDKLQKLQEKISRDLKNHIADLMTYAAENLQKDYPDHLLANCQGLSAFPASEPEYLLQWQLMADLLLTQSNGWRKQADKRNGFPPASGNKLEADRRARMKQLLLDVIRRLQEIPESQELLADVRLLPPCTYSDNEWEVTRAVSDVLLLAAAQLQVLFAEHNQMDFNGIAQAALDALGDEDTPTDLALHLDYQVRHLLVDECQDISVSQHRLLQKLTIGWEPGDGRTLFLVGDPQQSIYRFREAEVGLFVKTFQREMLGSVPLTPLQLAVNFRSESGVVNWTNDSFAGIFPAEADAMNGAVNYTPSVAQHADTLENPLRVYCRYRNDGQVEAEDVINIITGIQKTCPDDTIAMLVRSRAHLASIVPQLKQHAIPFSAVEIDTLSQKAAIQDLLMITRAYLHPADRVAWLAVLRAPWCGLELETLHALFNDDSKTVFESLQQQDIALLQNPETREHLRTVYEVFRQAYAHKQRRNLRQSIEAIWCQLAGPATLASAAELDNAAEYFDLLHRLEEEGAAEDIDRLMEEVDQLYAASPADPGCRLQIMTIHKAKGLEFNHVILPGLGRRTRGHETQLLAWWLRPRGDGGEDLILGPIKEAGVRESPLYKYLSRVEQDKQKHEEARLLYVAVTRAVKSVHLLGHANIKIDKKTGEMSCAPERGSLLEHLWPVIGNEYEKQMASHVDADEEERIIVSNELKRLSNQWQRPVPPPSLDLYDEQTRRPAQENLAAVEYEWAGETIRHIGVVFHALIQRVADEGLEHWNEEIVRSRSGQITHLLRQEGVPDTELAEATRDVELALVNMFSDPRGQWLLGPDCKDARNEYRISGLHDGRIINAVLDRTFIDNDGTRWIIDYKTSRHEGPDIEAFLQQEEERYRAQLALYAKLLQAMDERPLRAALYYPLLQQWREVRL